MLTVGKFYEVLVFFSVTYCQAISRVIDGDDEVGKSRTLINSGVEKAAKQLEEYTKRWDE